eukprot:CAMPEP_0118638810 /NCGR_PEP_ID=MMETSP0785-20121206/3895_1 /TAXON_ID=91992 /ORGANISM="Bolidomonas pacifica, Strain CCMP 1866" /LENGTH=205 /DNA_ID=CAMNT_0006530109 /DNA_START=405 /DNA_END=1022 /DNA_ORIENTATION=-
MVNTHDDKPPLTDSVSNLIEFLSQVPDDNRLRRSGYIYDGMSHEELTALADCLCDRNLHGSWAASSSSGDVSRSTACLDYGGGRSRDLSKSGYITENSDREEMEALRECLDDAYMHGAFYLHAPSTAPVDYTTQFEIHEGTNFTTICDLRDALIENFVPQEGAVASIGHEEVEAGEEEGEKEGKLSRSPSSVMLFEMAAAAAGGE